MTHRLVLWALVLLMPALLFWIVAIGELNARLDRSPAVDVQLVANAIVGTPFRSPMLELEGTLLTVRELPAGFEPGEDIYLRFRREQGEWKFDRALKRDQDQVWTADSIDIPARVSLHDERSTLKSATPLAPEKFALSRRFIETLRTRTVIDVTLRRGAFGTVWIKEALEAGLPVTKVVAIVAPSDNPHQPTAIGGATELMEQRPYYGYASLTGWMAPIDDLKIGRATDIEGEPIGAVYAGSRVALAVRREANVAMFTIVDGAKADRYEGEFAGFDQDGSFWSKRADPFPTGTGRVGTHRRLDGAVIHELSLSRGACCVALTGEFILERDGDEVRRNRVVDSRLEPADRWEVRGLQSVCVSTDALAFAHGSEGVFRLKGGQRPERVFDRKSEHQSIECDREGNVVVIVRPEHRGYDGTTPADLHFVGIDGKSVALGKHVVLLSDSEAEPHRMLRTDDRLYFGSDDAILVFDLVGETLQKRITLREIREKRRIL